jgi:murein DD-endopeptidase MepM/ murein hydrolase activator NlpD
MSKVKYKFNTKSLAYEKVETTFTQHFYKFFSYIATGTVFAAITVAIAFTYFDSPKEKIQKREIENLRFQYDLMERRMGQVSSILQEMQERDDNIYRVVFEAEPIPDNVRKAGFGGVDRYKLLMSYENSDLIVETSKKLDQITKQLYIQSKSFDEIMTMAKNKEKLLASIPAIQPISNKALKYAPSGYGWRTDPIYKTPVFHPGIDFTSNTGTEIYATGDGVVEVADDVMQGYGNHVVINHGFGYETLYGHMSRIKAYVGQKVKRGELIGYVGSTGRSTGPHVHYEVIRNGEKVNPINYFFNDLSPAQYQLLTEQATRASQSFD